MVVSIHPVGLVDQASEAPREGRASLEILTSVFVSIEDYSCLRNQCMNVLPK